MANAKKNSKPTMEELQAELQALIAQGRKEGMIRAEELSSILMKMDMSTEKSMNEWTHFGPINY